MEEKLKLILKRIHWSSLLKAGVFGLAWLLLPFWIFFLVALYLYFVPWFQVGRLILPFFVLLLLSYVQTSGFFFALIFAAAFYLMLLVKDLLILDRRSAYEILILAFTFFLLRDFYMRFNEGIGGAAIFYAFLTAAVVALLMRSFVNSFAFEGANEPAQPHFPLRRATGVWLSFLLLAQILIAGLFLPLDFIYQSTIVFLIAVLFIDLTAEYLLTGLTKNKTLGVASTVFALLVIVLSSARWGL